MKFKRSPNAAPYAIQKKKKKKLVRQTDRVHNLKAKVHVSVSSQTNFVTCGDERERKKKKIEKKLTICYLWTILVPKVRTVSPVIPDTPCTYTPLYPM